MLIEGKAAYITYKVHTADHWANKGILNGQHNDNHDTKLKIAKVRVKKLRVVVNLVTRCQILISNPRGAIQKGPTRMYLRLYFLIISFKLPPQQRIAIKCSIFNIHRHSSKHGLSILLFTGKGQRATQSYLSTIKAPLLLLVFVLCVSGWRQ